MRQESFVQCRKGCTTPMMEPATADVYLVYRCPKCESEHQMTVAETRFPGGVLCWCGAELRFKPVKRVDVSPEYVVTTEVKQEREVRPTRDNSLVEQVVVALGGLGYSERQAREEIERLPTLGSVEDYLREVLNNG